jgi:hypothetical protein
MEVAVESLAAPHERAPPAASADGRDAAFQLGLAKGAGRLETAIGGRLARCEKWLARHGVDERASAFASHGFVHSERVPFRLRGGKRAPDVQG